MVFSSLFIFNVIVNHGKYNNKKKKGGHKKEVKEGKTPFNAYTFT